VFYIKKKNISLQCCFFKLVFHKIVLKMRTFVILLFLSASFSFSLYSQGLSVVPQSDIWYVSERGLSKGLQKVSSSEGVVRDTSIAGDSAVLLNFHVVDVYKSGVLPIKSLYDISRSMRLTVIVVFHSPDTMTEHGIWGFFRGEKQFTGLTDRRLLRPSSEYVYPVKRRGIPLINTSIQAFTRLRGSSDSSYFVLGGAVLSGSTFSSFSGRIAECLVFDRFLKKPEALKIETYLAIKYGITLIESNYISPFDVILWNYEENKDYSNGIAGLGRDTVYGLNQKQGCSSEEDSLLTIGVGSFSPLNKDNNFLLKEGNYLVWGHNDKDLVYNSIDCETAYPLMERKWLIQSTNTKNKPFSTWVKFRLPEQYRDSTNLCYLVIDRSGNGDFSSKNVEYIVQSRIDTNGYVYFENVTWNANGKNVFSFSLGADLETDATSSCPTIPTGSLSVEMCGGASPFEYVLIDDSTQQQYVYQGNRNYTFGELAVGYYTLTITDIYNNKVYKKVAIGSDSTGCGDSLVFSSNNNRKNAGKKSEENNTDKMSYYYNVYPNPASGTYHIAADLPKEASIRVRLYTATGSLLSEWKGNGKKRYLFDGYLSTQGNYIVEIETVYGVKDFKLTIVR